MLRASSAGAIHRAAALGILARIGRTNVRGVAALSPSCSYGIFVPTRFTLPNAIWKQVPLSWSIFRSFTAFFPLAGVFAFLFDQQGLSYRFLADRGVRPGLVWLSRQLAVWVVAAVLAVAFSVIVAEFGLLWADYEMPRDAAFVAIVLKGLLAALSRLQCSASPPASSSRCSSRNGFSPCSSAFSLSAVLAIWYGLMWLWDINWYWSVLPIPLVLAAGNAPPRAAWLAERNTLRAWLPVALVLLLPAATLLTAVPLYRAYQIPAVDVGFPLEEFDRPPTPSEQTARWPLRAGVQKLRRFRDILQRDQTSLR